MTNTFNYDKNGEMIPAADYCPATRDRCETGCPGLSCKAFEEHIERGSE